MISILIILVQPACAADLHTTATLDGKKSVRTSHKTVASPRDTLTEMEFVTVPSGCFRMGDSYGDGQENEKPVHDVCLETFRMGTYEVTNAQYRRFKPDHVSGAFDSNTLNGDNQPVVNISWSDAVEYARWMSEKSGKVYRLPSEAEWEYAARGGTTFGNYWGDNNPYDACLYANGADYSALAQWPDWAVHPCDDGYKVTAPVGSLLPNAFGLYDMLGNAAEWVQDYYSESYYSNSKKINPQGPASGEYRVFRGGSWRFGPWGVRTSTRSGVTPGFRIFFLGFRLVAP